jgi:hypothetical protein
MVLLMKSAEEQRTKSYVRPIKSHCTYLVQGRRTNHIVNCLARTIKYWWHRVSKSKFGTRKTYKPHSELSGVSKSKFTGVAAEF